MKLIDAVLEILKQDNRFFTKKGILLHNSVYEAAMNMDPKLLELLFSNNVIRNHFFRKVEDTYTFDKVQFGWFINNRQFIPDSYTHFSNKIGLSINQENLLTNSNELELLFPNNADSSAITDNQFIYSETLTPDNIDNFFNPKVLIKTKRFCATNCQKNIVDFYDNDNLIINGDNLSASTSLLHRYEGKIKLIYFDSSNVSCNSYSNLANWLNYLKPRLTLAKRLLNDSGSIWINVCENGMHYLKVLGDDLFGSDHFIGTIPYHFINKSFGNSFDFSQNFQWILAYTKATESNDVVGRNIKRKYYETSDFPGQPWRITDLTTQQPASKRPNSYFTMVNPKTGEAYPASKNRTWSVTKDTFDYYYDKGSIVFPGDYDFLNITKPYFRKFKSEDNSFGKQSSVISDFLMKDFQDLLIKTSNGTVGNSHFSNNDEIEYSQSENIIENILKVATNEEDLVLDFSNNSGEVCSIAHKMNRHYIGIGQITDDSTIRNLKLAMSICYDNNIDIKNNSFVYCELAKLNQNFIDEILTINNHIQLNGLLTEILDSPFINYQIDLKELQNNLKDFKSLSIIEKKRFLLALLDKNQLYVNLCDIEDKDFNISDNDVIFNKHFYNIQ